MIKFAQTIYSGITKSYEAMWKLGVLLGLVAVLTIGYKIYTFDPVEKIAETGTAVVDKLEQGVEASKGQVQLMTSKVGDEGREIMEQAAEQRKALMSRKDDFFNTVRERVDNPSEEDQARIERLKQYMDNPSEESLSRLERLKSRIEGTRAVLSPEE